MIAVETDERQHRGYDKQDEEDRYSDLYMIHSGNWIFIRFNPDGYRERGKWKNPKIERRLPVLLNEIDKQIERITTREESDRIELVEIVKLYYDKV